MAWIQWSTTKTDRVTPIQIDDEILLRAIDQLEPCFSYWCDPDYRCQKYFGHTTHHEHRNQSGVYLEWPVS